jgi:hypothetical protein
MHELVHYYLTVYEQLAMQAPVEGPLTEEQQDFANFLEWRGIDGIAAWQAMSFEQRRVHTEAFAFTYEEFLFEGKAPSVKMGRLFHRIRVWMIQVYRDVRPKLSEVFLREFGEELPALNDEMRGVMSRMLASAEMVEMAKAMRSMSPHFESQEAAGATDAEWARLQQALEDADAAALTDLTKASLKTMELVEGPWRGKVLAERAKKWREERKRVRGEAQKDVAQRRVYRTIRYLRKGELVDDAGNVTVLEEHKLHTATVHQILEAAGFDPNLVNLQKQISGMTAPDGVDPDVAATNAGYASGEEMIKDLMAAPREADAVRAETDVRMQLEFGELNNPEEIRQAVARALHDDARQRFNALEHKFLTGSTQPVRVMNGAARAAARASIARRQVKDIRPHRFELAEARAAREVRAALKRGDEQAAAVAMRQQLLQSHMAKEAMRAQDEVAKAFRLFRKVQRPDKKLGKTRNVDMVGAMRAILHAHGIVGEATGAKPHLDNVRQFDEAMYQELADLVAAGTVNATPWRAMAMEDFRVMTEAARALWERSRRDNLVTIDGKKVEVAQAREEILGALKAEVDDGPRSPLSDSKRKRKNIKALFARLRHTESVAIQLDGGRPGAIHKYLFAQLREAFDDYMLERNAIVNEFNDRVRGLKLGKYQKNIDATEWFGNESRKVVFRGRKDVVGALLHAGNMSNLRKLLLGRKWVVEPEDVDGPIDTSQWWDFVDTMIERGILTEQDFEFVQWVWDQYEEMWPRLQRTNMAEYSYRAETIPAEGFSNRFGSFRGGYVPAIPDIDDPLVQSDPLRTTEDDLANMSQEYRDSFASAGRGMMMSRVEYNRPLQLDVRLQPRYFDQHLRFIHLQGPGRDILRLLRDRQIAAAIGQKDGTMIQEIWKPWLEDTMRNRMIAAGGDPTINTLLIFLRRNTGLAVMFANVANALQQLTGLASSLLLVDRKYLRSAAMSFLRNPREMSRRVKSQSKFMNLRLNQRIGQIRDDTDAVIDPGWLRDISQWTQRHAFFMQAWLQYPVDVITWQGAYDEASVVLQLLGGDAQHHRQSKRQPGRPDPSWRHDHRPGRRGRRCHHRSPEGRVGRRGRGRGAVGRHGCVGLR